MIYGYVRVSTDKQDCENQKLGVKKKAEALGLEVQRWIEDHGISGVKEPEERALGGLLKKVVKDDVIIVSELSRLGRSLYMVFRILDGLAKKEVKCYSHKDNFKLDSSIESKVMAFAFSLAGEIERDMISRRTKEALERKRSEGAVLGRPIGSKSKKRKLDDKEQQIVEYLDKGLSYAAIARMTGAHRLTVANMVKNNNMEAHRKKFIGLGKKTKDTTYIKAVSYDTKLLDEELIALYKKCHYSLPIMAKEMNTTWSALVSLLKRRNLYEKIKEANEAQRQKVKSSYQLAREQGITREQLKGLKQ
jgi:DNA invertase Pin-like site-specific DNA recombinase